MMLKEKELVKKKLLQQIDEQNWSHLTNLEQAGLKKLILLHESLFIHDDKELGLIKGPPAHI